MWSYEFSSDIMDADNDVDICSGEDKWSYVEERPRARYM